MNNISWLIYLADVLPSFSNGLFVVLVLASIASAVLLVVHLVGVNDAEGCPRLWFARILLPVCLFFALATNLIPSKDTFYLIAGSEMGEDVLKSPEAQKVRKVINSWLDEQLDGPEQPVAQTQGGTS